MIQRVFANGEMQTRVMRTVRGRDVRISVGIDRRRPATHLYGVLQALDTAWSEGAGRISLDLDTELGRSTPRDGFLADMFRAAGAAELIGADRAAERRPDIASMPRPAPRGRPSGRSAIWGGRAHAGLLAGVSAHLRVGGSVVERVDLPSGDAQVTLPEDPAGRHVYLLEAKPLDSEQAHRALFGALRTSWEATRAGADGVTLMLPYLPYSRSDRRTTSGANQGVALLARMMRASGIRRVVTFSLHQPQEVAAFEAAGIRVVHAAGERVLAETVAQRLVGEQPPTGWDAESLRIVAPDAGAAKRARVFARLLAERLGLSRPLDVAVASKTRSDDGQRVEVRFDARLDGATVVIVDDETASGSTLAQVARAAIGNGAAVAYGAVSHLTGSAAQALDAPEDLQALFVTNTVPVPAEISAARPGRVIVSDISDALAGLISALDHDRSTTRFEYIENP